MNAPPVRRFLALVLVLLASVWMASSPAVGAMRFAGHVTSSTRTGSGVELRIFDGSIARIEFYFPGTVRVRWNPAGQFSTRPSSTVTAKPVNVAAELQVSDTASTLSMSSSQAKVVIGKSPLQVTVLQNDGSIATASLFDGFGWDSDTGMVLTRQQALPGAGFFGMGERGGPINRRGRYFYLFNVDWAAYEEFTDPLYSGTPFYYGVYQGRTHGVFLDNPATPIFDFDSEANGAVTFGARKGELDYYVMVGPAPANVAREFRKLTGVGPLPPLWSLGYHQSRYGYLSQDELLDLAQTFRSLRIPADVLYLDIDYQDRYHQFTWNSANFPSPVTMNAQLEAMGFKRVNIFDACLIVGDPLRDQFAASGLLLAGADKQALVDQIFLGDVSWIDFTKPATRWIYQNRLKKFLAQGISGTWIDLNEPASNFIPQAIYDFGGDPRSDLEARNLYALEQARLFQEAQLQLRPNTRPWVLSRAGYTGIHRYAANWGGDANTSFDSLRVSIEMSVSMGLSGQNQFGHDIGGFLGSPSAELFIRWLEFGQMIPLFRNHAMNTSAPREPWRFGEPYTSMARDIISQRYRMLPYLYSLFDNALSDGRPVLAPTAYYFPGDENTFTQNYEFMLGSALLVAPVFVEGARSRQVYLPKGSDWIDYYTDTRYSGGQTVELAAPLERIPLLVRAGSILPSGPVKQYVGEAIPSPLTLDVYPGGNNGVFSLYEDDGSSFDYRKGQYLRTYLLSTKTANVWSISMIRQASVWRPAPRRWHIRLHLMASAPRKVTVDGQTIPPIPGGTAQVPAGGGWVYDAKTQILAVSLPGQAEPSQLVVAMR